MSDQNNITTTASKTSNSTNAFSSPAITATLAAATGVPGWQIQSGGHLSAIPIDNGNTGMSLVGFGSPVMVTSATTGAPKSLETSNKIPENPHRHSTNNPNHHILNIVIIACGLTIAILVATFIAVYFLRRSRRRRLQSFSRRTSELKRQSTIHAVDSKPTMPS